MSLALAMAESQATSNVTFDCTVSPLVHVGTGAILVVDLGVYAEENDDIGVTLVVKIGVYIVENDDGVSVDASDSVESEPPSVVVVCMTVAETEIVLLPCVEEYGNISV